MIYFLKEETRAEPSDSAHPWHLPPWSGIHGSHHCSPSIGLLWLSFVFLIHCSHHHWHSQPMVGWFASHHFIAPYTSVGLPSSWCGWYVWAVHGTFVGGGVSMVGCPHWHWAGLINEWWYSSVVGLMLSMGGCLQSWCWETGLWGGMSGAGILKVWQHSLGCFLVGAIFAPLSCTFFNHFCCRSTSGSLHITGYLHWGWESQENQDWEAFIDLAAVANINGNFVLMKTWLGSLVLYSRILAESVVAWCLLGIILTLSTWYRHLLIEKRHTTPVNLSCGYSSTTYKGY